MYFHTMLTIQQYVEGIKTGDRRTIAKAISFVENEAEGYELLLKFLSVNNKIPVIGITGPPGAGKSTLVNELVSKIVTSTNANGLPNQVAIIAVDPTSPFTHGSLLGDRLRMSNHFTHPSVYIRSLATRGALGGLSAKTIEITDILRAAPFDYILIETVGVGQSEVEIISLADTTLVVLVPESGDEIQAIKSGIMEIGDIFIVNKADRDPTNKFYNGLVKSLHERPLINEWSIPILKTVATKGEGIDEVFSSIINHQLVVQKNFNLNLMAERAYRLIQNRRMKNLAMSNLMEQLTHALKQKDFNLYSFIETFV